MKVSGFFRRMVCFALVCLLLIPAARADALDLARMTNEELVAHLAEVNAEIVRRGLSKTAKLPQGKYNVGTDIPAGRYIYTCLATGDEWGNLTVYSDGGKGRQILWNIVSAPDAGEEPETIFMTLSDGDQLDSGVPFSLMVMAGIIFQ